MVKVKKTEPLAQLNIKIAPALRRAVEKAALAEERSISNFARSLAAQSRILAAAARQLIPTAKLPTTHAARRFSKIPYKRVRPSVIRFIGYRRLGWQAAIRS